MWRWKGKITLGGALGSRDKLADRGQAEKPVGINKTVKRVVNIQTKINKT